MGDADLVAAGGLERNKHADKKLHAGRGTVCKAVVAGVKDRQTGLMVARDVTDTSAPVLVGLIEDATAQGAEVFTDEHWAYQPLGYKGFDHSTVAHSVGEYVAGQAHTNGIESFWSMLKRFPALPSPAIPTLSGWQSRSMHR